jgi:hypothetical protein
VSPRLTADRVLAAVAAGADTPRKLARALGVIDQRAGDVLAYLALKGALFRVTVRPQSRGHSVGHRYQIPDSALVRRAWRVERMRAWIPQRRPEAA